jgi:hypothetical protein
VSAAESARGLAHSKSWRSILRAMNLARVLETANAVDTKKRYAPD